MTNEDIIKFNELARSGDIVMVEGTNLKNRLIRLCSGSKYSHCGLIYNVHDSRVKSKIPFVIDIVYPNARMIPLVMFLKITQGNVSLKRYSYLDNLLKSQMKTKMLEMLEYKYDLDQLIRILVKRGQDKDNRVICSQLVDMVYSEVGISCNREHGICTPKSIAGDEKFNLVIRV